jgi:hypothetical protein
MATPVLLTAIVPGRYGTVRIPHALAQVGPGSLEGNCHAGWLPGGMTRSIARGRD